MNKPVPPKARLICEMCGTIGEDSKHTNVICRFFQWLDKTFKVEP